MGRRLLVRVGARVEQELHQLEVAGLLLAEGLRLRIPGAQRPLDIEGGEERARAVVADQVGVGAALQEIPGEVVVAVDDRHEHRRGLVAGGGAVDVRAALEQQRRRRTVALARRVVQRIEAALPADLLRRGQGLDGRFGRSSGVGGFFLGRRGARSGLCGALRLALCRLLTVFLFFFRLLRGRAYPRPVPLLRAQLPIVFLVVLDPGHQGCVGPGVQQGPHGRVGPAHRTEHERRPLGERIAHVRVATVGGQQLDHGTGIGVGREVHCGDAGRGEGVGIGAGFEDQARHLGVAAAACEVKGIVAAEPRGGPNRRTCIEERLRDINVVVGCGPVQRRHAVVLGRIDVRALAEQGLYGFQIAAFGGIGDRGLDRAARTERGNQRCE